MERICKIVSFWFLLATAALAQFTVGSRAFGTLTGGGGGGGNYALVQSATQCYSTLTNSGTTKNFTSNVTSGDILIIAFKTESTGLSPSVTDSLSTSFGTAKVQTTGSSSNAAWIWVGKATASGADTVSLATPGGASWLCLGLNEFSGLTGTVINTASTITSSGSMSWSQTVSSSPALIFAAVGAYHSSTTFTAGTGFTITSQGNGADAMGMEWQKATSSGTATVTMTVSTSDNNVGASVAIQ